MAVRQNIVDQVIQDVGTVVQQFNADLGNAILAQGAQRDQIQDSLNAALALLGGGPPAAGPTPAAPTKPNTLQDSLNAAMSLLRANAQTKADGAALPETTAPFSDPGNVADVASAITSSSPDGDSGDKDCPAWKTGNFSITGTGNANLAAEGNVSATISNSEGDPAPRGDFISVRNQNPTYHFYFGIGDAQPASDLGPGKSITISLGELRTNVTEQVINVKYCTGV